METTLFQATENQDFVSDLLGLGSSHTLQIQSRVSLKVVEEKKLNCE